MHSIAVCTSVEVRTIIEHFESKLKMQISFGQNNIAWVWPQLTLACSKQNLVFKRLANYDAIFGKKFHGICNQQNKCQCNKGYTGIDCSEYFCPLVGTKKLKCNGNGVCLKVSLSNQIFVC